MSMEFKDSLETTNSKEIVAEISAKELEQSTWENTSFDSAELKSELSKEVSPYSENLIDQYIEHHERLHDSELTKEIATEIENMDGLRYENWTKLSEEQKLELLNSVEQTQARIEHRDAMTVELEDMPMNYFGYQDSNNNRIVLNRSHILSDNPFLHRESIDTIVHEGRHAYQHYNVEVRTVHESDAEVESWRQNFSNSEYGYYQSRGQKIYIPLEDGSIEEMSDRRLYEYQPVEIDARNFASDVMSKLDEQGMFGPYSKR